MEKQLSIGEAFRLSKEDSLLLKGIAILLIIIHNFSHAIPGFILENEYTYDLNKSMRLLELFNGGEGSQHTILNMFSHYGHYGVSLFLFLSGYGLVSKYERGGDVDRGMARSLLDDVSFVFSEVRKMWGLLIPGLIICALLTWCSGELHPGLRVGSVVKLLTFTSNLFPTRNLIYGVWWFFSLMVQFYFGYRFLIYRFRSRKLLWGLVLFSILVQIVLLATDQSVEYLRFNAIGWLLPFALGIELARNPIRTNFSPYVLMLLGGILWLLSAFNAYLWLISPIFFLMLTVPLAWLILSKGWLRAFLEWVGYISPALFVLHPIIRGLMLPSAIENYEGGNVMMFYAEIGGFVFLSLLAAWLFMLVKSKMPAIWR